MMNRACALLIIQLSSFHFHNWGLSIFSGFFFRSDCFISDFVLVGKIKIETNNNNINNNKLLCFG